MAIAIVTSSNIFLLTQPQHPPLRGCVNIWCRNSEGTCPNSAQMTLQASAAACRQGGHLGSLPTSSTAQLLDKPPSWSSSFGGPFVLCDVRGCYTAGPTASRCGSSFSPPDPAHETSLGLIEKERMRKKVRRLKFRTIRHGINAVSGVPIGT